uniref:Uncharacterized protein n=1 Tax=Rhizophora mucronata TaxID=61149 RepID=A0A2P2N3T5_RHIMU
MHACKAFCHTLFSQKNRIYPVHMQAYTAFLV